MTTEQPRRLYPYFNANAAQAGHPRLAVLMPQKDVDRGPEPVPGLVPGSRHDGVAPASSIFRHRGAGAAGWLTLLRWLPGRQDRRP
jgi:hypothetical protein